MEDIAVKQYHEHLLYKTCYNLLLRQRPTVPVTKAEQESFGNCLAMAQKSFESFLEFTLNPPVLTEEEQIEVTKNISLSRNYTKTTAKE